MRLLLVLLCVALPCAACASPKWVRVRETPRNPLADQLNLFARGGPKPTPRTMQLLRRYDLESAAKGDARELLVKLHEATAHELTAEHVYAKAELAYIGALKSQATNKKRALDLYGAAAMHAYQYLFDPQFALERNPYDPQYRGASELYNTSLESAMRIVQKQGNLIPGTTQTLETASQTLDIQIVLHGSKWQANDFERFEFVSDYEIEGLRNHYLTHGLGVPLIAVRKQHEHSASTEQFYPPQLSVPMTAFLRFHDNPQGEGPGKAVLELHDPLMASEIDVAGRIVPLQSDLSTPLAYFLDQPEFSDSTLSTYGLLNPDQARTLAGLYMLEPYQPGKIPVIMVHGLWSSPVTWMEMFNDLRSDPELRRYYQFWFYMYPTGQPFWFSATQMRQDLQQVRQVLDPERQQPSLDQMVLVGHSMGGLVSKMQTIESGDEFWQLVSDKPFADVNAEPETRETLQRTFFFSPNTSVRRVVTIGTPHRGSRFANDTTRWLGQKLISLPQQMLASRQKLLRDNPDFFRETQLLQINTSIDSLAPDSPILPVMLEVPTAPWVRFHNIVGKLPEGQFVNRISGTGDGVVELWSSQLDNVESQIVIEADHSQVHRHPRSILEVRRILLEHLHELRTVPFGPPQYVTPVSATQ